VEPILLALKAAFLVLLYLFIWRVIKAASRDLRVTPAPQESFIMAPAQARAGGAAVEAPSAASRMTVVASPSLELGSGLEVGPVAITLGRADDNSAPLPRDDYASSHHARIESARDGVWIVDLDSTNGTWVNGERIAGRRRLHGGDVVRVGQTELRLDR
jgi:pSer/pThr/pTyr-binding forkhead associated (FHA) protein